MKASHAMRAAAKVRSQNTSTADTVTSMNTVNAAVSRHGRGGGRRQRFFGHGVRLVILDILSRDDSHGYELIKAIENLTRITLQARASFTRRWIFCRSSR